MDDTYMAVFSNQVGIAARVCPRGHVYLQVGYACLTLRHDDFLDLAQVIRAAETYLVEKTLPWPNESQH
jgi:hypothetical protein